MKKGSNKGNTLLDELLESVSKVNNNDGHLVGEKKTVDYILGLSVDEMKRLYIGYKEKVSEYEMLDLHEVYMMIFKNELNIDYLSSEIINTFSKVKNLDQKATV